MDRLQKNCVIVSASLHGLLAGAFLFGSAFRPHPGKIENPNGWADLLPAPPEVDGAGPQESAKRLPTEKPQGVTDFAKPAPARVAVSTTTATRVVANSPPATPTNNDQSLDDNWRQAVRLRLGSTLRQIGNVMSSGKAVNTLAAGFQEPADYAQIVKAVYTRAWNVPADVDDDKASTKVSVTVAQDGRIISARIVGSSHNTAVDESVQRALECVRTIGSRFPADDQQDQRTFTINFNLKAKRLNP